GHEEQGGLAHAGLAADEHERRGNETTSEHSVKLRHAGWNPLGLLGLDVDESKQRPRGRSVCARRLGRLLVERPEAPTARAAAEPASGGLPALGAGVFEGALSHAKHSRPRYGRSSCRFGTKGV